MLNYTETYFIIMLIFNQHSITGCHTIFALILLKVLCIRGHSITTWTRWGGRGTKNVCFCPRLGYKNCPRRGGGINKWQNSVQVVVEWPLSKMMGNYVSCCMRLIIHTYARNWDRNVCDLATLLDVIINAW